MFHVADIIKHAFENVDDFVEYCSRWVIPHQINHFSTISDMIISDFVEIGYIVWPYGETNSVKISSSYCFWIQSCRPSNFRVSEFFRDDGCCCTGHNSWLNGDNPILFYIIRIAQISSNHLWHQNIWSNSRKKSYVQWRHSKWDFSKNSFFIFLSFWHDDLWP